MNVLSATIEKCQVPLKLDNNTEGYGNCFPNVIVQQCRRPEIKEWLLKNKPCVIVRSDQSLRRQVRQFALESQHKTFSNYRRNYETILNNTDRNWKAYWDEMGKDGTWVDSVFVQVTAWFLGLDIKILTTSSKPKKSLCDGKWKHHQLLCSIKWPTFAARELHKCALPISSSTC